LDGFQVIRVIRQREQASGGHLPVIALTARSRKEDRDRCLAAGMDDFLVKPVRAAELWEAIDQAMTASPPALAWSNGNGTTAAPDLLDPQVLLAACGSDELILQNICQAFRAGLPRHLTSIEDALRDQDAPRLREAAHKFCGMIAAFSTEAADVTSNLEDQAASGRLQECRPLVERLIAIARQLIPQLDGLSIAALQRRGVARNEPTGQSGPEPAQRRPRTRT
jgi:HPt (histidine-containing phosphotransfer) domain-containing protein